MAKAADGAHAVELAGLFLKPPDQEHGAQCDQFLLLGEFRRGAVPPVLTFFFHIAFLGYGHDNFRKRENG